MAKFKNSMQKSIFAQTLFDKSMESKLIVKNFGPIKHVELDLRNVNVFIGPQASGKSTLAKLYTIFKAPRKFFYQNDPDTDSKEIVIDNERASKQFKDVLKQYNIDSFLRASTEIEFTSDLHTIEYKKNFLSYVPNLLNEINSLEQILKSFNSNSKQIKDRFFDLADKFVSFDLEVSEILGQVEESGEIVYSNFDNLNSNNCKDVFDVIKDTEKYLSTNAAWYIPAERTFSNIIKKAALNLLINKAPIPQHILSFGAELEKLEVKKIDLGFIQKKLSYNIENGEDRIIIDDTLSIMLSEAASGIQSVIPILAPILNNYDIRHKSFVIEEPELNLFPLAQYELIQLLEVNRKEYDYWNDVGTIHTYTTHSPYILSALNNLLYAFKVHQLLTERLNINSSDKSAAKQANLLVSKIVKTQINPDYFTAYQISDGIAQSIFNRETGLIEDNFIDESSDKINEDFEALMELTK